MDIGKQIFLSVFWGIMFFTSCNGQVKTNLPNEHAPISAGQPKLTHRSTNTGDNVHCSLQDRAGNFWFGTTGYGVYKYDGKSFTRFTVSNDLNSNMVYCMLEAKDGKIWIGTEAGAYLYDGKTFSEIQIPSPKDMPPNKYQNTHDVFSIMQDKSGKLWFAAIDGVY